MESSALFPTGGECSTERVWIEERAVLGARLGGSFGHSSNAI